MYLDRGRSSGLRTSWKYDFLGKDLWKYANALVLYYAEVVERQRTQLSKYLADRSMSTSDRRVTDCRTLIETAAAEHERCLVYAYEFERTPERVFYLDATDMVYFGIVGQRAGIESADADG